MTFSHPQPAPDSAASSKEVSLEEMERRLFRYFVEQAHPETGLVKDRADNFAETDKHTVASMAATGFGLAALVVGAERGYIPRKDAQEQALRTLRFVSEKMPDKHGWLYHFVDYKTGERVWNSEASTIDTALFIMGAIAAGEYFKGTEVEKLARRLYERMDFNWMRTDGGAKPDSMTISMGWRPETGFINSRWRHYDELLVLLLPALSSTTHRVPDEVWGAWERDEYQIGPYKGLGFNLPLFVHQYIHSFADLKDRPDRDGRDYWKNSVDATRANRWFSESLAEKYKGFGKDGWGLSAIDGPDGYRAYGLVEEQVDGTLSPIGVVAAIPFLPEESLSALKAMHKAYGEKIWGKYGYSPFNPSRDWWGREIIGIDAGAALLLLDRYRHKDNLIPNLIEKAVLHRGLKRAGFKPKEAGNQAPSKGQNS